MSIASHGYTLTVQGEPFGILGRVSPKDGRVDFKESDFEFHIEAKGQRLAWSRATRCPCTPIDDQTEQPDPTCVRCRGLGWFYFGAPEAQNLSGENLTDTQVRLLEHYGAFLIRGLLIGANKMDMPLEKVEAWRVGSASVTVRPQNRISYMDRLINLDAEICFTEVVTMPSLSTASLPTRYLVSGPVQLLASLERRYVPGVDFWAAKGKLAFAAGRAPAPGTRLTVHYVTYPTWVVQDMPNVYRNTNVATFGSATSLAQGDNVRMPLRAQVRLEFLPEQTVNGIPLL